MNNSCIENGCKKKACFNIKGNPPLYCRPHKNNDMINVNQLCVVCYDKRPSFNLQGLKEEYCKDCKTYDMIDVKHLKCIGCNKKRRVYNLETLKAEYCFDCKTDDMINVVNLKCVNCNKLNPIYNKPGFPARYCFDCKTDDMINVKNKRCSKCNKTYPVYNKPGLSPEYCKKCKDDDMINVISIKCIKCDKKRASYNLIGLSPEYCEKCKDDDMINVRHKKCIECKEIRSHIKYDDHCLRCYIYKFPDNEISRSYKVKEKHVQDFIEEKFPKIFRFDKQIDGGCSKRRPDVFKDCLTHILIIEVDEYQHRNYEEICENKRMMEIFGDTYNRPIVFIRFNPDSYINENKEKIESSFKMHKKSDVPIIRNKKEWNSRLFKLKKSIQYNIKNIPEKEVTIINLYYDSK
jgi:hypothetical protein